MDWNHVLESDTEQVIYEQVVNTESINYYYYYYHYIECKSIIEHELSRTNLSS